MAQTIFSRRTLVAILGTTLVFSACKKTELDTAIPANTKPVMYIEAPAVAAQQGQIGDAFAWAFRAKDNEALRAFRIVADLYDEKGGLIFQDSVFESFTLSGKDEQVLYPFIIPTNYTYNGVTSPVKINYRWALRFYVLDTEGQSDSSKATITVIDTFAPADPYKIEAYTNITMDRGAFVTSTRRTFNFAGNFYPTNTLDMDIREFQTAGPTETEYRPRLISPNNNNGDSVFAVVSQSTFNYEAATYSTIKRAFRSAAVINDTSPKLNVNDVLIVRLRDNNSNIPQYAVMVIRKTNRGDANGSFKGTKDFFVFDYKYTYKP